MPPPPTHTEIMFPFLKQIVWYSGTTLSVSVNTTVFIAAISNSEQLGNSVYANEARAALGLVKITLRIISKFLSSPQMTPPGYCCRETKITLMRVM